MTRDPDAAMVQACTRGDREALETLVDRYERRIYNAAYRIVGNGEDAGDVTQAVFLKVFERLDQYDDRYRFFSWIYRIAVNESINFVKRRKRQAPLEAEPPTDRDGPADALSADQARASVQRALQRISPEQRAVIVLRHFADMSYREMAETLEVPEKTVKSRLFEARRRLADLLKDMGGLS